MHCSTLDYPKSRTFTLILKLVTPIHVGGRVTHGAVTEDGKDKNDKIRLRVRGASGFTRFFTADGLDLFQYSVKVAFK
jgi:hypothetical protein